MKAYFIFVLALFGLSLAVPEFCIDPACDNVNGISHREGIIGGVQEAIDLADNAYNVLNDHINEENVQKICKAVLGDSDFRERVDMVKEIFENIKAVSKTPSQFKPTDQGWVNRRDNKDVVMRCDASRFTKISDKFIQHTGWRNQKFFIGVLNKLEKKCYLANYQLGSGAELYKALAHSSDYLDQLRWFNDINNGENFRRTDPRYSTPRQLANDIDICTWFSSTANNEGWPKVDVQRIERAKTAEFRDGLKFGHRPVDALKTFGSTMLHELTHTNQGGKLLDANVDHLPDVESCYGWACVTKLHDARNADSIALLGIALKVWSLGYHVDTDGNILSRL